MRVKKPKTLQTIENKYSRKVAKLLERYKDRTIEEFWKEADKLKAKMKEELAEIGITE